MPDLMRAIMRVRIEETPATFQASMGGGTSEATTSIVPNGLGLQPKQNAAPRLASRRTVRAAALALLLLASPLAARLSGPLASNAVAKSRTSSSEVPKSISDLVAVQDDRNRVTIYLADAETGAIYSRVVSTGDSRQLELSSFKLFFRSGEFRKPSALTHNEGRLIICDSAAPAVIEVNIQDLRVRVLWQGKPLQQPISVAASYNSIAIADAGTKSVFWLEAQPYANANSNVQSRNEQPRAGLRENKSVEGPVSLVSDSNGFFVLEGWRNTIFEINSDGEKPREVQTREMSLSGWIKNAGLGLAVLKDFAFYRGIFYLTDGKQIVAFTRTQKDILPVVLDSADHFVPSRIVATNDRLIVADKKRNVILSLPRPAPVNVNLDTEVPRANDALVALYHYLFSEGILPTHRWPAEKAYDSLEQLLIERSVLILGLSDKESEHSSTENETRTRIEALMCKLNPQLCEESSSTGAHVLARKIEAGEPLTLPSVHIRSSLTTSRVDLKGKPVSAYLASRIPLEKNRVGIDAKYLFRINASLSTTFEGSLARFDFIPASPTPSLEPGVIFRVEKGLEVPAATLVKCGAFPQSKQEYIALPEVLTAAPTSEYLPRVSSKMQARIDLRKLGVDRIEMRFQKTAMESLDLSALRSELQKREVRTCADEILRSGQWLVVNGLKVVGATYRLLRQDGSVVLLNTDDLRRWGLLGQPDPDGKESFVIKEPFYIGYRAFSSGAISPQLFPDERIVSNPSIVKPGNPQDILSMTTGTLSLPAMRWQLTLLVNTDDLINESSPLRRLEIDYKGVRLLSGEELPTKTSAARAAPARVQDTLDTAQKNRQKLKEDISYPDSEPSGRGVIIGIGEKSGSVDRRHPDFIADNRSAWLKAAENFGADFEVISASEAPPAERSLKNFNADSDHGTHIAGLLAARPTSLTPGLVPAAGLFLVDTASPATLQQSIQDAINRGVFLFNFSFTIQGDALTANSLRNLKIEMRDTWREQLFVVAAGNESRDLKDWEVLPIRWVEEVKNIIGVGASKGREDFLDNWEDRDRVIRQGSNFSKKYVQLLAPGLHVYSTAPNNTYAEATGTSQAVPQVTAAAAMLWANGIKEPLRIKARLIYTADWFSSFQNKVWGGLLNVRRAVREPNRDYLITQSNPNPERIKVIAVRGTPAPIIVRSGRVDDPGDGTIQRPALIPFPKIMRIAQLPDHTFRVFYLDGITLRVIMNADLDGIIPCDELLEWDPESKSFKETPASRAECVQGIRVSQIFDYVAKVPPSVTF